jgi:hypothetical protein
VTAIRDRLLIGASFHRQGNQRPDLGRIFYLEKRDRSNGRYTAFCRRTVPGATIGIIGTGVASTTDADEARRHAAGGAPLPGPPPADVAAAGQPRHPGAGAAARGSRWFARLGRRETWLKHR